MGNILSKLTKFLFMGPSLTIVMTMGTITITCPNLAQAISLDTSQDNAAVLAGYGQSFPGWGLTTERVETIDLVPRYNHVMFSDVGAGWWRGDCSTMVEMPLHFVVSPDTAMMVGMNFLGRYTFVADDSWRPYIMGGGGPVYSFADIDGMGAELNGNYQFGMGLNHPIDASHALLLELRYHHISNGGATDPNVPLNSLKLLFGVTF